MIVVKFLGNLRLDAMIYSRVDNLFILATHVVGDTLEENTLHAEMAADCIENYPYGFSNLRIDDARDTSNGNSAKEMSNDESNLETFINSSFAKESAKPSTTKLCVPGKFILLLSRARL